MSKVNSEYQKYIQFFLDSVLSRKKQHKIKDEFSDNPNKKLIEYIKAKSSEAFTFSTPLSAFWNLTSSCNFRCKHCLYNDSSYSSQNDLTESEASLMADELIDMGISYIVLSGGEIFLRKDLMKLVEKFKSNNVALRLLTNGSLLNNEIISRLSDLFNPYTDTISISLDGATADTFKNIRQTDSFNKVVSNIENLVKKNIRVTTVCIANIINYNEISDTYNLASELGVYKFIVGKIVEYNDSHKKLALSNEQLFKLYYKLLSENNTFLKTKLEINFFSPIELLNIQSVKSVIQKDKYQKMINKNFQEIQSRNCHCHDRITIDSNGTVYLCLEALANNLFPLGNFKQNTLLEIWKTRYENKFFKPRNLHDMVCHTCGYNKFCNSGCMVKAYFRSKNINNPEISPCGAYIKA